MNWFLEVLKKYAVFSGRARRKEFWMFVLISILFGFLFQLFDYLLGIQFSDASRNGPIYSVYSLVIFIPSMAVSSRRLHDTGKSAWYLLLWLLVLIGWVWLLVLFCTEGDHGPNKFGPDPKGEQDSFNGDALDSHLAT